MAEELYFLKLNPNVAKIKLVHFLNVKDEFSYREYINKHSNKSLIFDDILKKIEVNIELLSRDEFMSIFYWFYRRIESLNSNLNYTDQEEKLHNQLSNCGMELFFEIPSKTPVRKFHSVLNDYECQKTDLSFICKSEEFNDFLKYGICFTGELFLFLNKYYYKDESDTEIQKEIEKINLNYGKSYHELALKEFMITYEFNIETINLLPSLLEFRRNTMHLSSVSYPDELSDLLSREDDLINLASIYYYFLDLREKLDNYSGTILRLHSF
ncbi:hypothetical protein [Flavobacterium branchiicola]|uniref:Cthe-2314-like HEPN domain-containing protein n=1 Tax=Flavobacterium branchiicola TaxID=1114875 RepID=A0ABV9PEG5_9FLAO|nr:hypothetical protein [Flavobacterium branchiicola]MBS7255138.1 hypothetical protein [Flavobacterium branchiicola]